MGPEEKTHKSGNSNIGIIRSSKKQKQKKVPQRGLGVAQLEKIRLQEQQRITLKSPPPPSPPPPPPTKSTSSINTNPSSVPIPRYHSSIPYPSDISSPSSILRPENLEFFNSNITLPLGWQSVSVHQAHGNGNAPRNNNNKIWNSCEFNLENLPYDQSNSIWPLHSLIHQSPLPPMMNVSSTSSSSSSPSLLNLELPSNQNYYGNYAPIWPEEEKMVSKKRACPFAVDSNQLGPPFHCKFPTNIHPIGRPVESSSFGNGPSLNFATANLNFRESSSCCDSIAEQKQKRKKNNKENGDFNGDFLTLAPPATTLTYPNSKLKRSSAFLAFYNCETFDFSSLPYQGIIENTILQQGSSVVPNQQQPNYYRFLPPVMMLTGQPINNCNGGEVGEIVDLNLKL